MVLMALLLPTRILVSRLLPPLERLPVNCELAPPAPPAPYTHYDHDNSPWFDLRLFGWLADLVGRKKMYGLELMISTFLTFHVIDCHHGGLISPSIALF